MEKQKIISRRNFIAGTAIAALAGSGSIAKARNLARASQADHIIDGLSFLPENLDEIRQAGLTAMICDVSKVEEVRDADGTPRYQRNFAINNKALEAAIDRINHSEQVFVAKSGREIGLKPGCAAFLQFQSCETIGNDLGRIGYFHAKGLRVLQLTHHNDNLFAGGAIETEQSGLTKLGRAGIAEMNRVGLLPDVSHGSVQTILEAAEASRSPIVYSHGALPISLLLVSEWGEIRLELWPPWF